MEEKINYTKKYINSNGRRKFRANARATPRANARANAGATHWARAKSWLKKAIEPPSQKTLNTIKKMKALYNQEQILKGDNMEAIYKALGMTSP